MLPSAYNASDYEDELYKKWEESGAFRAEVNPDKKPFTIPMPPPNATGTLHLGHAVMLAIQDVLARHRRMKGYETLWLPGTDHAAIATQNKVEKILAEEGITREQLGREVFLSRVKEYVAESQSTIRNQIRKMGSSCDWSRERYTLDEDLSRAVTEIFVRMYEDGLVYRGHRIVNWCTRCQSTLADDEVEYKEVQEPFYYIKYGPVTIGTARPETKFADKIIVVHPEDERYKDMIGKEVEVDWIDGKIMAKFVADEASDMEMGSGAMTITPAHSFVDFDLAQKYGFEVLPIIDTDGKMLPIAGEFAGMDVRDCRHALVEKMKKLGLMEKIDENYTHNLSVCYRCDTPIEPLVSDQWFIDVNKKLDRLGGKTIRERTDEVVKDGSIRIIPDRFKKGYFSWTENLRDWCISRQIWWGHRIPVWYCDNGSAKSECLQPIVSRHEVTECPCCKGKKLRQDEDTLDTWFSSGLWTFSTLGWPDKTPDLEYFHPAQVLETGYDILTFWILRMVLMTTYAMGEVPFENVYLHGLIRDREGRKMSKSLGNGIDPLEMIEKFGTDALRMSMLIGNTPGNDMRLYEEKIKAYRNFTNKLWNASRFVIGILEENKVESELNVDHENLSDADEWILGCLNDVIKKADDGLMNFRLSEVGQLLYDFLWHDFCDWYLELSKGEKQNINVLYYVLKNILILLHPFAPFVTEQIWNYLPGQSEMLIHHAYPQATEHVYNVESTQFVIEVITKIRSMRSENKINPADKIPVTVYAHDHLGALQKAEEELIRLARISDFNLVAAGEKLANSAADVVHGIEIYIPLEGLVDPEQEKKRLEGEIAKLEPYLKGLSAKLSNDKFVSNAPADIVEAEKAKLKEGEEKLAKLKAQLQEM